MNIPNKLKISVSASLERNSHKNVNLQKEQFSPFILLSGVPGDPLGIWIKEIVPNLQQTPNISVTSTK